MMKITMLRCALLLLPLTTTVALVGPQPQSWRLAALQSDKGGGVQYDAGSGWKPDQGGMGSTDTGDYFYEDGDTRNPSIEYTDGIMGSTGLDKLRNQQPHDPGVAGALEVDPTTIKGYQAAQADVTFELDTPAKMGMFTQEINLEMPAGSSTAKLETVFVKPVRSHQRQSKSRTASCPSWGRPSGAAEEAVVIFFFWLGK